MAQIVKTNTGYMVRVTWRDENGKQHKKSKAGFKTKAAARKAGAEMEQLKYNGMLSSKNPAFIDYYIEWYKTYKEPRSSNATKRFYDYCIEVIRKNFGKQKITSINRQRYQQFINNFGQGKSKHTVIKVNAYIRVCVKNAVYDGIIPRDFTQQVELSWDDEKTRKIDYLSITEMKQVIAYLKNNRSSYYTGRYMILTAFYTGMRLSEIQALSWDDVDYENKTISINKSWDAKLKEFKPTKTGSSNRTIRVNDELLNLLDDLKQNKTDLIFENPRYHNIPNSATINKVLRRQLESAGVHKDDINFHSLRHSHVAYLLERDVPLYAISKRLGHSNMTTTANQYAYLIDEFRARSDYQIEQAINDLG